MESAQSVRIDASGESFYIRSMPVKRIQVGQVWKEEASGESYLITKVYNEALNTYAVLRRTGAETEPPVRVRVTHNAHTAFIPGFTYALQSDEF